MRVMFTYSSENLIFQFLNLFFLSGIPLQLDWLLSIILPYNLSSGALWRHIWVWSVPHQMDSHRTGTLPPRQMQLILHIRIYIDSISIG